LNESMLVLPQSGMTGMIEYKSIYAG